MKTHKVNFHFLKKEINELYLDPAAKLGLKLAFMAIGLQLIFLALCWHRLPPQVPLWYSRAYGDTRLADSWQLVLLPGAALAIELGSIRLASIIKEEARLWSQLFSWTGAIAALMALVTLVKIILLAV